MNISGGKSLLQTMLLLTLPRFTPKNIDVFYIKRSIQFALEEELERFSGVALDVGCGYMPYKSLILNSKTKVKKYIGLDFENSQIYKNKPDLFWDGKTIPLPDSSVDCAIVTEVFEHCPDPEEVMKEIFRVLRPCGILFFTVPFLWPLHDVPFDEYRYTPFALRRHLENVGFKDIQIKSLGGWDASLAQMIGLWTRRRLRFSVLQKMLRVLLSLVALPIIWILLLFDKPSNDFIESSMITGISGTAVK